MMATGAAATRADGWPITFDDVAAARERLAPHLAPTALRHYPPLDEAVGGGIRVAVKHENHQPTNAFKIRNGLAFATALTAEERGRGIVAASTGNHGQGIAYGARLVGTRAVVYVPRGNNPEKIAAMRALGAEVVEAGSDYDAAVEAMHERAARDGLVVAHSTNDPRIIAGAATLTLEIVEQARELPGFGTLDALVLAVGGGSQVVGALTVARALAPSLAVYGVGAAGAPAQHDSWHRRERLTTASVETFAEGVATRATYDLTWPALRDGLAGFVTATEGEIAAAMRLVLRTTHTLVEGSGALGLAGLLELRERLAGQRVGVALSGANVDAETLRRVLTAEL